MAKDKKTDGAPETAVPEKRDLFTVRIKRTEEGLLTVSIRSRVLEAIFRALSAGDEANLAWTDGKIEGEKVAGHDGVYKIWRVPMKRLTGIVDAAYAPEGAGIYKNAGEWVNLAPLLVRGLAEGITLTPMTPCTVDSLATYAKSLEKVVTSILKSVQPVDISLSVRGQKGAADEAAA